MASSKARCKGTIRASTGDPVIIPCWPCWPKLTSCSTAGSAAATAEQRVKGWGFLQEALALWGQRQKIRIVRVFRDSVGE